MSKAQTRRVQFRYPEARFRRAAELAAERGADASAVLRASLTLFARSEDWRRLLLSCAEVRVSSGEPRGFYCARSLHDDVSEWLAGKRIGVHAVAAASLDLLLDDPSFRAEVFGGLCPLRVVGSQPAAASSGVSSDAYRSVGLELTTEGFGDVVAALESGRELIAGAGRVGRVANVDLALRQLLSQLGPLGGGPNESC